MHIENLVYIYIYIPIYVTSYIYVMYIYMFFRKTEIKLRYDALLPSNNSMFSKRVPFAKSGNYHP